MKRAPTLWTVVLSLSLLLLGAGFATAGDKEAKAEPAVEAADTKAKPKSTPAPTPEPTPASVAKKNCSTFCDTWCAGLEEMSCSDKALKDDFKDGQKTCKKTCPKLCAEGSMPDYLTSCLKGGDCKSMNECIAKKSGGEEL
jgi:hypothetical protein